MADKMTLIDVRDWHRTRELSFARQQSPQLSDEHKQMADAIDAHLGGMGKSIRTDDGVELVAKAAGWNNRRYMTPSDYAIWCDRMREFVRIAVGASKTPPQLIDADASLLQRYFPSLPTHPGWQMSPDPKGEWVLFSDVQALLVATTAQAGSSAVAVDPPDSPLASVVERGSLADEHNPGGRLSDNSGTISGTVDNSVGAKPRADAGGVAHNDEPLVDEAQVVIGHAGDATPARVTAPAIAVRTDARLGYRPPQRRTQP